MGRTVVITGGNRGIGRATVRAVLYGAEDTRVLLGSRSRERGEGARSELLAEHPALEGRLEALEIDVSSDDSVAAAAATVSERLGEGSLYGLINNAGIGEGPMRRVLDVNTLGPRRVCEAFLPLLQERGRIVNVSSAAGPNFVASCGPEVQQTLTSPQVTWEDIEEVMEACLAIDERGGDFKAAGFGTGSAYGLSKACLNAYTIALARSHPEQTINACTPGFIETDLTRRYATSQGVAPAELGMKPPEHGAKTSTFLLLGDPGGSGWYFGSDQQRSPLDRYRSPGDPPYRGD